MAVPESPALAPLEVLVIEDDTDARELVGEAVRDLGYSCREAADGNAGWAAIQNKRADIVLSDWSMPGLDGDALCKRVRSEEENEGVPYTYFMFMTSYSDKAHYIDGMRAGADDYLKKPLDLEELQARLDSASRVVRLHRRVSSRAETYKKDSQHSFRLARTDPLTGMPNRLRMEEDLNVARARAARYGTSYALSICDIDHFKPYNDAFGHVAGDEALRAVTRIVREHLRASDGLYRYGGEEFLILLPEQRITEGRSAVERARAAVERELATIQPTRGLTISAGVADLRSEDTTATWLDRADKALYRAKSAGRNQVKTDNAEVTPHASHRMRAR